MSATKAKWDAEDAASPTGPDATDALLSKAIETALAQGKGWKSGEKEAYMAKYFEDEDYLDLIFATTEEELERTGMRKAFESVEWDDPPGRMMGVVGRRGTRLMGRGLGIGLRIFRWVVVGLVGLFGILVSRVVLWEERKVSISFCCMLLLVAGL